MSTSSSSTEYSPYSASTRKYSLSLLLTIVAGLGVTAILFRIFVELDRRAVDASVVLGTEILSTTMAEGYDVPVDQSLLYILDTFAKIQANAGTGKNITRELLDASKWDNAYAVLETTNLVYMPKLSADEIKAPQMLRNKLGNIEGVGAPIMDYSPGGATAASEREEYFPVLIEAGYDSQETFTGLDYSAEPLLRLALIKSRDAGTLGSYTYFPTKLPGDSMIVRYFSPLYDTPEIPVTIAERREHHIGFIAAFTLTPAKAIVDFLPKNLLGIESAFYVNQTPDQELPETLYREIEGAGIYHEGKLFTQGNELTFKTRASPQLIRELQSNNRWWVLSIGFLLTAWMSSVVFWSSHQSRKIYQVVAERTRDLAERTKKLSEVNSALTTSEQRYRMLADNISDVIYTTDIHGICTYISPSILHQTGYDVDDYIGVPIYTYMIAPDAQLHQTLLDGLIRDSALGHEIPPNFKALEFTTRCKDGTLKAREVTTSTLFDSNGKYIGLMGVIRDISERKQAELDKALLESAYRQSQKMEAIGTLAGGVAHDFNNLLTGIIGHTELLKLTLADHPAALHNIDVIDTAAVRAKELTSQLLGFARKGQFQTVPVDINLAVTEVITLLERTVDKNIELTQFKSSDSAVIMGDPSQLSQVFLNLAVNACDAMPKGGKLTFDISVQELDEEFCRSYLETPPGKYCVITVSDTGIGIAEDKIEHIFEPFYTDKEDGKGTGLGLAMVYGVTRNHNGNVTVYSEAGSGTVFTVYLPASDELISPTKKTEDKHLIQGAGNILLVDDQEIVRHIGARMLEQLGYAVTLANDGEDGLAEYRRNWQNYDLVIIDMIMPKMGGLDCLDAMYKVNPNLKAILASGFSRESITDKIHEAYIMGFLQKPFRLHELSDLVASIKLP